MKANRKFVQADDAVSPVIAVILMVAITVVLAATVFVLLQGISPGGAAARVGFQPDETGDRLNVNAVPTGNPLWNRFGVMVTSCTAAAASTVVYVGGTAATDMVGSNGATAGAVLNAASTATACGAAAEKQIVETTAVTAGEYLDFCAGPTTLTAAQVPTQVVVKLRDREANEIVYEHTFIDIGICAA